MDNANRLGEKSAMKKLTRIGTILLTLGVSLALLSLARASSNQGGTLSFSNLAPQKWDLTSMFWPPRSLRLEIDAQTPVNLKLRDPSGVELLSIENVEQGLYTVSLGTRGTYSISIYNPSNSKTEATLNLTLYDLEKDLLTASAITATIGIAAIATQYFLPRLKRNKQTKSTYPSPR